MLRKYAFILTLLISTWFISAVPAAAQGIILPPPDVPGVDTDPRWLSIDYHRVNVDINNQVATTNVEMQFTNNGERLAEGTFIFPLPAESAVEQLTMTVDGLEIDAKILRADEAREIYNEIVRQYRDPALLEYIGTDVIQANIFPIPPGESRKVEIVYGQVLELDNGLLHYVYPMSARNKSRLIEQMSISVNVTGNQPISNVYSPSHPIAISRPDDTSFRAGFESSFYRPDRDFSLFFGLAQDEINLNLLSFKESANEDGFFMLMLQPPLSVDEADIQPKDVVIVLDQSGSMDGTKWTQAQTAATDILGRLNPRDRFNVVAFSTGYRIYGNGLMSADEAPGAIDWVKNSLFAEGGTNINAALETAFGLTDNERALNIIFLTDGLATEGITDTQEILKNLRTKAPDNTRIFTFGVGDDVDTFLLDTLVQEYNGVASYVRPSERIDEEVASLYNKISAPVMNNVDLTIEGAITELVYPTNIPNLYAGEQITVVGRYRNPQGIGSVTISGEVKGEIQTLKFDDLSFRDTAGGEDFIARLWATRRIGGLLNQIRLNGESPELVDSVVNLSIRYGIITPYTSFLIEEDDILSEQGRRAAMDDFAAEAESLATTNTGAGAVDAADMANQLNRAQNLAPMPTQSLPAGQGGSGMQPPPADGAMNFDDATSNDMDEAAEMEEPMAYEPTENPVQNVNSKTFILQDMVWNDTTFDPDNMTTNKIEFLSDAYFELLEEHPEAADYLALGDHVIFVLDGVAYEIVPA